MKTLPFLTGDGRKRVLPQIEGLILTEAQVQGIVNTFDLRGQTIHSGNGDTLWVVLAHCRANNIPFKLEGKSGFGFVVNRMPNPDFTQE